MANLKSCLELFSGSGDISLALRKRGMDSITVDYDPSFEADLHRDVYSLDSGFFKLFDFVWASPDCTTYSLASHGRHRKKGGEPVSDYAKECDVNNRRLVVELYRCGKPFIIENPRGFLRHMPFMDGLFRWTVYYSRYGAPYAKPTDLFSNYDLSFFFDTRPLNTHVHLDYVAFSKDFLGRCHIPSALVDSIAECILALLGDK